MTKKQKHRDGGRLTDEFDQNVADEICHRISLGETMRKVTAHDDMPDRSTVTTWARRHISFHRQLTRARLEAMFAWADDVVEVAENAWGGSFIKVPLDSPDLEKIEKDGVVTFRYHKGHVREADLLIRTKTNLMKSFNPETFGDRQILDVRETYIEMSDEELLHNFVVDAKRAGITAERIVEIFEEYGDDDAG